MAQILVVEDEESLLQTLRYNLSRAGHEVRLSTNGLQALDMIRGNPPELVGQVLVWLLSDEGSSRVRNGKTIHAADAGRDLGLLPAEA